VAVCAAALAVSSAIVLLTSQGSGSYGRNELLYAYPVSIFDKDCCIIMHYD
jgi:hypothetical protein